MSYLGDIRLGDTVDLKFTTVQSTGAPTTLAGTPVISAYPANSTTQLTAGITLTVDFDTVTGLNHVRVVASSGNGYATATNYDLVITTGTVNSVSVVGYVVGSFSIENRSAVMPTTAARTLDVSATGEAGVDWANVGSPSTTVGLSGTTVGTATTVTNQLTAAAIATGVWQDTTAGDFTTASSIGKSLYTTGNAPGATSGLALVGSNVGTASSVTGSVGSVTGAVGSVTGNVGGNVVGSVASVTAAVTISAGTGAGQLDVTSGVVKANLAQILGTALTETAGQLAAAFKKFFNIATPASTMDHLTLVDTVTTATTATSLTNAPTAGDFTATMKTSIGTAVAASAVASVTGNVGGNVVGSVGSLTTNNDKTGYALTSAERNSVADALLDRTAGVETNFTPRQSLRLMLAALAAKLSGAATTTVTIRDINDTKARITATVDSDGNRTAVTTDVS